MGRRLAAAAGFAGRARPDHGLSRRTVLTGTAVAGAALAGGTAAAEASSGHRPSPGALGFAGRHQAGVTDPPPPYLMLAAFDVLAADRAGLVSVLQAWTAAAAALTAAAPVTLTAGFGPSLWRADRFGLAGRRPAALAELPPFPGEALDPAMSGGDLCVQACADDPATAHHAVRALVNVARPHAVLRWRQTGYRPTGDGRDPRNLFGFRDGTANLDVDDPAATAAHLWVDDGPAWLHGGTYLVVRRIRLLLDTWDRTALAAQEAVIGRGRDTNRRLDPAPASAHARLAAPDANGGATVLRRP